MFCVCLCVLFVVCMRVRVLRLRVLCLRVVFVHTRSQEFYVQGDHGGETPLETDAAMFVYSKRPIFEQWNSTAEGLLVLCVGVCVV